MDAVGCESFGDYLDYLEVHPDEYEQLFETLLINVTEFFRDPPAWEHLREERAAGAAGRQGRTTSRCASGAPAARPARRPTRAAMVLAELLGVEAFRERVKIYATDIDEDALDQARLATYTRQGDRVVPAELRERYFERADQRCAFRKDLRRTVIFGRNNLVAGRADLAPGPADLPQHADVLQRGDRRRGSCATSTSRCATPALLMLGKSEMMISHRDLFAPADLKQRIFLKLPRAPSAPARGRGLAPATAGRAARPTDDRVAPRRGARARPARPRRSSRAPAG